MRPPKFHFKPAQWGLPIFKSQPQNSLLSFHRNFLVSQPDIFLSHLDQQAMARLTFFSCQVPPPTLPDAEHWAGWTWGHVVLVFPMHGKQHVIPASEQLLYTADISTRGWYCGGVSSKAEMLWHREDCKAHVGCLSTARRAQTSETEQSHQAVQENSFPSCEISGWEGAGNVAVMPYNRSVYRPLVSLWQGSAGAPALPSTRCCEAAGKVAWIPWGLGQALPCSGEDKGKLFAPLSSLHIHSATWLQSCGSVYLSVNTSGKKKKIH